MCSAVSIQQENCRFSEKYTSLNLPDFHNFRPFRDADYRLPIQFQKVTPKQAIYLHGQILVSFWSAERQVPADTFLPPQKGGGGP